MFKDSYQVIGVMSGTSLDGVDLVYLTLTYSDKWDFKIRFSETIPYSDYWFNLLSSAVNSSKQELLDLNESYTEELARIINSFILKYSIVEVDAVASHGHTVLHQPQNGFTTLNDIFNNDGLIYYIGTRAENKYSEFTDVEITRFKDEYQFTFLDTNNLYTNSGVYLLNGSPYAGYFYTKDGISYAGRNATDTNIVNGYGNDGILNLTTPNVTGSTKSTYFSGYKDIIDNCFGVRILPDGRIGYRTIYATDPCYTGATQEVTGITNNSFIDFSDDCDDFTVAKIITKYFTIEESYTRYPVINQNETKFLFFSVTFERDFSYETKCLLKYGAYRNGTLSMSLNGFTVYRNPRFREFIPHELDTEVKYQESVPFNISFGGGTQGLFDAVYLDPTKRVNGIIEKFFAGTFEGGVRFIEMYSIPLYIVEIRDIIKNKLQNYNLYYPKGGRRVFIKNMIYINC